MSCCLAHIDIRFIVLFGRGVYDVFIDKQIMIYNFYIYIY